MSELENSIKQFNSVTSPLADDLYGLIYYFQKKKTGTDADNISKTMWDCLKGILFNDDNQVKLRIAGTIDISKEDYTIIDVSNLGGEITAELTESFDSNNHIVYVEVGLLNNSMYKFNLEKYGN